MIQMKIQKEEKFPFLTFYSLNKVHIIIILIIIINYDCIILWYGSFTTWSFRVSDGMCFIVQMVGQMDTNQ